MLCFAAGIARNVSLTAALEKYVRRKVATGLYNNVR